MNLYLVVLVVYGTGLIGLGIFLSRSVKKVPDFFIAGRRLGPGLLFSTVLAANIGAGSTVGAAALGYLLGLSGWWWVGSAGLGSLVLAFTVGPKIRRLAQKHSFLTVGDFLEQRYGVAVRGAIATTLWFGSLAILAGQLMAFSRVLEVVAGTSKTAGCLLGGIVVVTYFTAAGLHGAAWINLLQLLVKAAGFILAVPFALAAVGGWQNLKESILEAGIHGPEYFSLTGIGTESILAYLVMLVPSFIVSPGLLQKVYGARDGRAVRLGVGFNAMVLLLFAFLPVLLGMMAAAAVPDLAHEDLALPTLMVELVPFWLGSILLAAVFSAEISSADAILFMLSTSLARDLYQTYLNPQVKDGRMLSISRWISIVAGGLSVVLAILLPSVIAALEIFYSLLVAALFIPLVVGLYRARPGLKTCLTAIITAISTTVTLTIFSDVLPGFLSPTAAGILVSLLIFVLGNYQERRRAYN